MQSGVGKKSGENSKTIEEIENSLGLVKKIRLKSRSDLNCLMNQMAQI